MSVLDTAPTRVAMMLRDAHPDIRKVSEWYVNDFDTADRPGWTIRDESGNYGQPKATENSDDFTEALRLQFFGMLHGQGDRYEYEQKARQIVAATIRYLRVHTQLQFSNQRELQDQELGPLRYVKWTTIQRQGTALMTLEGGADTSAFWGCILTLNIIGQINSPERYIG